MTNDLALSLFPRLGALAVLGTALVLALKQKRWSVTPSSQLLSFFMTWILITTVKAPDPGAAFSAAFALMIPSATLFVLAQFWIYDEGSYELLVDSLSISIATIAALAIGQFVLADQGERIEGSGIFANSNDLAALCVLSLPLISRAWLRKDKRAWFRRALGAAIGVVLLVTIYFAQFRGAHLSIGIMGAGILVIKSSRFRWSALAPLILALAIASLLTAQRSQDDLEQSTASRIEYLRSGLRMAVSNPVLGVGWGRYPEEFDRYSRNALFESGSRTAHNSWILVLAELGWLGLGLFLTLFAMAFRSAWQLRERQPELFLALLGYTTTMTFLSHSYLFYPYLLLGIVFGAGQYADRARFAESANEEPAG